MGPSDQKPDEKEDEREQFWAGVARTMGTAEARRDLQEEAEWFAGSLKDGLDEDP